MNFTIPLIETEKCSCSGGDNVIMNNDLTQSRVGEIRSLDDYNDNNLFLVYFNYDETINIPTAPTRSLLGVNKQ